MFVKGSIKIGNSSFFAAVGGCRGPQPLRLFVEFSGGAPIKAISRIAALHLEKATSAIERIIRLFLHGHTFAYATDDEELSSH
jgi:hypothetical protein